MAESPHTDTSTIAAHVMEAIARYGLQPTPETYRVWFTYFADSRPDLTRAVRELLDGDVDAGFDESLSDSLNVESVLLRDLHLSQTVVLGLLPGASRPYACWLECWRPCPQDPFALWSRFLGVPTRAGASVSSVRRVRRPGMVSGCMAKETCASRHRDLQIGRAHV